MLHVVTVPSIRSYTVKHGGTTALLKGSKIVINIRREELITKMSHTLKQISLFN